MSVVDSCVQGRAKTLDEAKQWMRERLEMRVYPMSLVEPTEGRALIDELRGLDGRAWAGVWGRAGDQAREAASEAERRGERKAAAALYLRAHGLYFMGRFPCPNHPDKQRCAELERETYLAAGRHWSVPVRRVSVPFDGRRGEGREVVFLYRRPEGAVRPPVVVMWGGLDAYKEQLTGASDALLGAGVATIAVDCPGTGESPLKAVVDAERQFLPVFDWAAAQLDVDARKVGLLGRSFGGYWATKLAHAAPERIAGAVSWGGGVHFMFQPEWLEASRHPESYLMELAETHRYMLGSSNGIDYAAALKRLSLLDQGLLDRPCAPLLLVSGKHDRQYPVEDTYLLLERGSPKSVRLFPGGHTGRTPQALHTVVAWLAERLRRGAAR
ncbi:MAG TPA: alpha/beta fold hydrolase [Polyangiaceae bacterium]|nr:alpha/beta fold hydrolase [Polyangiaceae bacterium]